MVAFLRRFGYVPAPKLQVSAERVNDELQSRRRHEVEGDVEYRDRVKRRMMLGYACQEPPLIVVKKREPRQKVVKIGGKA